uniref:Uncharacterized protein n=1 Tax=Anguilla anguilla TaxID=7936 RepID=A0A0E9T981_ANGAN
MPLCIHWIWLGFGHENPDPRSAL